ncbi:hypothetical protein A2U01_0107909, partial [Trifolium medium]|nr:hypothetical protein [Trifolium medium]
YGAESIG